MAGNHLFSQAKHGARSQPVVVAVSWWSHMPLEGEYAPSPLDWSRDWGSLRRFDTLVDAPPADLDLGTATHFGWYSPGKIRIKP
jgi:EmbC-like arabinotransferase in arabinogalactan biosynthesis